VAEMRGVRLALAAVAVAAMGLCPRGLPAQERPRITVRVRQVAGSTVYLEVGTRQGLLTGDTLGVGLDSLGTPGARMTVTASTDARSVLTFVGEPLAVQAGSRLTLLLLREPAAAPPPEPTARPRPERVGGPKGVIRDSHPAARTHGRVGIELSAVRSSTRWGEVDPATLSQTFATPGLRIDATVPDAIGGFRLRTSMRLAYRYSSQDVIAPNTSVRVYSAVLESDFRNAPFRLALGRFQSPVESYSGFWDGAFVRVGRAGLGAGAMVGFEPDRWDERPSTALPKATVFMDAEAGGAGWRWHGDVSAHATRPRDSLPQHTFVGVSQRLSSRVLYVSEDVQADRDPGAGTWRLSRVQLRGSVAMGGGVRMNLGASRRESWSPWSLALPFSLRSDRVDAGLAYRGGWGGLSADGSVNRDADGGTSWGATAGYALGGMGGLGTGGTLTRWTGAFGNSLTASPYVSFDLAPAWLHVAYQYSRSDYLQRVLVTHAVDGSLDLPLAGTLRASARARITWGRSMAGQSLDLTLYRIF
jgi:hypothetical protein